MASLAERNQARWNNMHVSAARGPAFESAANRIKANKAIYQEIEKETGVPWWFIGVVHLRESNLDMSTNIANGQSYKKKTTIVPKGRGPFNSFKEAAIDALVNCAPYAARNKNWSVGPTLALLESYNGLGYAAKGVPSPYVWAGTDQYSKGKYVADHVYDPNVVDPQLGVAGVIKFLGVYTNAGPAVAAGTGAAVAVGFVAAFWDHISHHLLAYGLGTAAIIGLIILMVSIHKSVKEETSV